MKPKHEVCWYTRIQKVNIELIFHPIRPSKIKEKVLVRSLCHLCMNIAEGEVCPFLLWKEILSPEATLIRIPALSQLLQNPKPQGSNGKHLFCITDHGSSSVQRSCMHYNIHPDNCPGVHPNINGQNLLFYLSLRSVRYFTSYMQTSHTNPGKNIIPTCMT